MKPLGFLILAPVALSGCLLGGLLSIADSDRAMVKQMEATAQAAKANQHTDMYVIVDQARLCPARTLEPSCPDGVDVMRNFVVTVVGQAPAGDVWPVSYVDNRGEHALFIAARSVNELPDLEAYKAARAEIEGRYPDPQQIPTVAINLADLLGAPEVYRGRVLVTAQRSTGMENMDVTPEAFTFTMDVPVRRGARPLAPRSSRSGAERSAP